MSTMMEDRGTDYVAHWPAAIASKVGISVEYVAQAMRDTLGVNVDRGTLYGQTPIVEVGAMTGDQARSVVARMVEIRDHINDTQDVTHCRYCGLPMRAGECEECGVAAL